jgi:hypothetical protein
MRGRKNEISLCIINCLFVRGLLSFDTALWMGDVVCILVRGVEGMA